VNEKFNACVSRKYDIICAYSCTVKIMSAVHEVVTDMMFKVCTEVCHVPNFLQCFRDHTSEICSVHYSAREVIAHLEHSKIDYFTFTFRAGKSRVF